MNDQVAGTVFLVGAGPGDPDLLTVKAHKLLKRCDAVLYDSLVPKEILDLVPENCECQFVGKRRGHHSFPQSKINKLLLSLASSYSCVVRLKGGDPFVFGRGGEEAAFLNKNGVAVEIVPGITAGIAAPSSIGIPITHRLSSSSVTFVTGHEVIDKHRSSVKWRALATASDTLVIYMGLHNLQKIVEQLIAGGLDVNTPSAIIHQATLVGQRFVKAPLGKLVSEAENQKFLSPSIIIVGFVVDTQVEACIPPLSAASSQLTD